MDTQNIPLSETDTEHTSDINPLSFQQTRPQVFNPTASANVTDPSINYEKTEPFVSSHSVNHDSSNMPPLDSSAPGSEREPEFHYESNPFLNAVNGLMKILRYNAGVSMLSVAVFSLPLFAIYGFLFFGVILKPSNASAILAIFALFFILLLIVMPLFGGVMYAIAAESMQRRKISIGASFRRALHKFFPIIGLFIVFELSVFLGFILLVIPGIIVMARGSLAFLVMFDEDLGPIKAFKRSFALTKGHTVEMLGSIFVGYFISGGYLLLPATGLGPFVGRYEDLKQLLATNQPKPKTSYLNWAAFIAPLLLFGVAILLQFIVIGKIAATTNNTFSPKINNNLGTHQATGVSTVLVNINSVPYCGAIPSASLSSAALSYLDATMVDNNARYKISQHVLSNHDYQNLSDIEEMLTSDQQFLASIKAIIYPSYPYSTNQDAANYESIVQNYDVLLSQEISHWPNIASIQNALSPIRNSRGLASEKLRQDLGLPQSACGFNTP